MRTSLRTLSLLFFGAVAFACHGGSGSSTPTPTGTESTASTPATTRDASPGGHACNPSSVVTSTSCPHRAIAPSNATSTRGCHSDAECTDGIDGRCVVNPLAWETSPAGDAPPGSRPRPTNVLAAAPPAPLKTLCVYDACLANADCGARARCACAAGDERNQCVALDGCLEDTDCARDTLCACGAAGAANACTPGNCRTSGDCAGGLPCVASPEGSFCRTPRDTCKSQEDCASRQEYRRCEFNAGAGAWACRTIPPRPPG